MKIQSKSKPVAKGFTLIEMIGVLAVIGILAALLIPKIFEAINNARVNGTAVSVASVKTSIADHYAKFGSLVSSNGTSTLSLDQNKYDSVLIAEGFLDKPFSSKFTNPTNTFTVLTNCLAATAVPDGANQAYDLGLTNGLNQAAGSAIVEIVMHDVLEADAKALNDLIDGAALGVPMAATPVPDTAGRVKYTAAPSSGGVVNMRVYLTHR